MFDLDFTKPRIATLSSETLSRVKALEQELGGACVVAYTRPLSPARLSSKQLQSLQNLEGELGLCMVAYEKPASRS